MGKPKTLDSFFKKKDASQLKVSTCTHLEKPLATDLEALVTNERPSKCPRIQPEEMNATFLERDPGLRPQIWEFPVNLQDDIRRAYIRAKPCQPKLSEYPYSGMGNNRRRFQASWFETYSTWLEYSKSKDAIFCLPCYVFAKKPTGRPGSDAFTGKGFNNWKKASDGMNSSLMRHVGKDPNSPHNIAVKCCEDLMNQSGHIDKIVEKQTLQETKNNQLRLKTSIDSVQWLTFQACPFRGHDESSGSKNQGNFIELVKLLASYNDDVAGLVLENAPKNAKYTSPKIQKEILHIIANKVRDAIRKEIGDAKFCILVDEARDESKREQMAIILRFVDKDGFIRERFFHIVHVKDTSASTLKKEICVVLSRYNLQIENIRGQGYDGASNMRGEWNGLQALFVRDCPYAYYVHCMAHKLQLALVATSREAKRIHQFFIQLASIINIVGGSSKRHDDLQSIHAVELENLVASNAIETGRGINQIDTLQRPGDTRWSSHYQSVCSMIRMYGATCSVINKISNEGVNYSQRGDAEAAYMILTSFEFILILHLMKEIMGLTNMLCQSLQQKSLDILNAMSQVSTTQSLIQKMRDDGWEPLLTTVKSFCEENDIDIPDMNAHYTRARGRSCRQDEGSPTTMEHHFRVDIFTAAIDFQLQELKNRFNEQAVELLILSVALSPKDAYKSFKIDDICKLAEKFYPRDFTEQEKICLKFQLQHYKLDVPKHQDFQNMSTLSELCRGLAVSEKSKIYPLIDRLIRLVLTLPVSTATTE
ncbi:uncharacterized protein LOC132163185 [Corylus avellana]|uniref:uncharacterized protein LOC132163185 n=1 Tax=Corylus avellana TaxID=13451 RepID=UPI00286C967F|nr:uncharacterized protein LOC132163185 [Corylus avellana]